MSIGRQPADHEPSHHHHASYRRVGHRSHPAPLAEAIASAYVLPDGFGAIAGRFHATGRGGCLRGSVHIAGDRALTVECGAPDQMSGDHRAAIMDLNLAVRLITPGGPYAAFGVDRNLVFSPEPGRFDPIGPRFVADGDAAETTIRVHHRHLSEVVRSIGKDRITHVVLACKHTEGGVLSTVLQRIVRNRSGGIECHQHLTISYAQVENLWFPERVRTVTSDNSGTSLWETSLTDLALIEIKVPDSPSQISWGR